MAFAISSPLLSQDAEPARFVADIEARPISAASDTSAAPASAPLRWISKPREIINPHVAPAAQPISTEQQPVRPGWNVTRVDLSVRPAQTFAPVAGSDPFNDPFGDRQGARAASNNGTIELEPTATEAGIEELPAPRAISPPQSIISTTRPAGPSIMEIHETAQPLPSIPTPATDAEGAFPSRPSIPCDRIYNDRNCCDAELGCTAFRNQLLSASIRQISLDITPRYAPDLSETEDASLRTEKLRPEQLRPWKSRTGELLATGRMSDYQNGAVVIVDEADNEVARLAWHQLGEDELCYLNAFWRLPTECTLGGLRVAERHWCPSTFHWHASALCHKPLYFEEVQLERYGHTTGPYSQPWLSGAHFFLNIAALPYNMAINPPHECQYALGYYRPGSCAPWMIQPIPISPRGAVAEAAVIVGGGYLIP